MTALKVTPALFDVIVRQTMGEQWQQSLKAVDFEAVAEAIDVMAEEDTSKAEELDEMAEKQLTTIEELANSLVAMFGGSLEDAMAKIIAIGKELQSAGDEAESVMDEPSNIEVGDSPAVITEVKAAAFDPRGVAASMTNTGGFATKNVRYIGSSRTQKPASLVEHIRAVRDNDRAKLTRLAQKNSRAYKALGINPDTSGGYLVPPEQSSEIIELLREEAQILSLCRTIPMNRDRLSIPTQTGGATVYWIGENSQITQSQQTFGQKVLEARKASVLVPISNELIADSDPDVDAFLREDIARELGNEMDRVILRGAGGAEPLGVLNAGVTSTASSNPTSYTDLLNMVARVEAEKVSKSGNWSWVFHPNGKAIVRQIKDGANQYIWTGSDGLGRQAAGPDPEALLNYGYVTTTLAGLGTSDRPRAFFGNWSDVVVGMRKSIEIKASDQAGTSFEYDQTWIRAIMRVDVVLRHTESIEVLTGMRVS